MIVDTSALVSILDQEAEAERLARAIAAASERMLSAANLVETGIVMQVRRGDEADRDLDLLLAKLKIDIIPVSGKQANLARRAFQHYGRGRHPAKLNFGDCFAYALAKDSSAPLLFKGNDFSQTDIMIASYWRPSLRAFELAGVEFIDENGGGPGVLLRKLKTINGSIA
jgi:ribonuclease VapC